MTRDQKTGGASDLVLLAQSLSKSPQITRWDEEGHNESDALAHALLDIDAALQILRTEIVPRLLSNNLSPDETIEVVWMAREQLRHVAYHIRDCKTFRSVLDN